MQIDADQPGIQCVNDVIEIQPRVTQQHRAQVDDLGVVPAIAEKTLQRFESNREIFVQRRDGHIAAGAQKRKVDVAPIAKIEDGGRMQQDQVGAKRRQRLGLAKGNHVGGGSNGRVSSFP